MILFLLAGCSTNWIGTWEIAHFELAADDLRLEHDDMGWISCDDDDACVQLRRYDIAFPELEAVPLERVWTEYGPDVSTDPEIYVGWGEHVGLELEVTRSTQTRIVLEGQARVTDPDTLWDYVDASMELTR